MYHLMVVFAFAYNAGFQTDTQVIQVDTIYVSEKKCQDDGKLMAKTADKDPDIMNSLKGADSWSASIYCTKIETI